MQQYYYNQLSKPEKSVYDAMLPAFAAFAPAARVLRLENARVSDIFCRLRLDHPELFYLKDYSLRYYPEADYAELRPVYLFDKGRLREHRQALAARGKTSPPCPERLRRGKAAVYSPFYLYRRAL